MSKAKKQTADDVVDAPETGQTEAGNEAAESADSVATESSAAEPVKPPEETAKADSIEAWKDRALRAQAEMANMRRRLEADTEDRTRRRMEALLHDLITVADHMDLALASIPEDIRGANGADAFLMGMEAIRMALESVMRQHGLEFIQPDAEAAFDPELHEAVQTDSDADLDKPRLEILRRGYRMGSKILRPAQVRVISPADIA